MSIQYIATANGYMSGRYIDSGEVFTSEEELTGSWFKPVNQPELEPEPEPGPEKPKKKRKAKKEAEGEKVDGVIE